MTCLSCGGPIWDNTEKCATGWKGPLLKCRDDSCGWVKWGERKGAAAARGRGPKWTWPTLSETYRRSLLLAKKHVTAELKGAASADVLAAAATIFIAATRDGVQDAAPAPAAAPLNAPPVALVNAAEEGDDLPF